MRLNETRKARRIQPRVTKTITTITTTTTSLGDWTAVRKGGCGKPTPTTEARPQFSRTPQNTFSALTEDPQESAGERGSLDRCTGSVQGPDREASGTCSCSTTIGIIKRKGETGMQEDRPSGKNSNKVKASAGSRSSNSMGFGGILYGIAGREPRA